MRLIERSIMDEYEVEKIVDAFPGMIKKDGFRLDSDMSLVRNLISYFDGDVDVVIAQLNQHIDQGFRRAYEIIVNSYGFERWESRLSSPSLTEDVEGLEIAQGHMDYSDGENYYRVEAYMDNQIVGFINYSEFENVYYIKYVEVRDEYRRRGVASAMVERIIKEHNIRYSEIDWGMTTDHGTDLKNKLDKLWR